MDMALEDMEMVMATVMVMGTAMVGSMEAVITWKNRKAFCCHSENFSINRKKNLKTCSNFYFSSIKHVTEGSEAVQ
jgi:hypothetical protein